MSNDIPNANDASTEDQSPGWAIRELLQESGVSDWDPRVVFQLLEFQHRMTKDLLLSSNNYANHAGRKAPTESDLRLSLQGEMMRSGGPTRKAVRALKIQVNRKQLPAIESKVAGQLRLLKTRELLSSDNYEVEWEPKQPNTAEQPVAMEVDKEEVNDTTNGVTGSMKYNVKMVTPATVAKKSAKLV